MVDKLPIKKYNRYFGGNAEKALAHMKSQYGEKKGEQVFYATKNKRKSNPMRSAIKGRMR